MLESKLCLRSSTHHAVSQTVLLVIPSTDYALVILELKNIIPTIADHPNQRMEGEQTNNNQDTESRNEEAAPVIVTTGSKFPKKPRQIFSKFSIRQFDPFLT